MGRVIKADARISPRRLGTESNELAARLLEAHKELEKLGEQRRHLVFELAKMMAERILEREIESDPDELNGIYGRLVPRIAQRSGATVEVHPTDRRSSDVDALAARSGVVVRENEGVGRGGCVVRVGAAVIDASIPTLLARLLEGVAEDG